jgi:hypothetical protein
MVVGVDLKREWEKVYNREKRIVVAERHIFLYCTGILYFLSYVVFKYPQRNHVCVTNDKDQDKMSSTCAMAGKWTNFIIYYIII